MRILKNDSPEQNRLLASLDELKTFLEPLKCSVRGSWVEALLWNKDIKMSDIDIQVLLSDKDGKHILEQWLAKMKMAGYTVEQTHQAKYIAKKWDQIYDIHMLQDEWDLYVEHSPQWDFSFPKDGYKEQDGIMYLTPEILLLMAKWSKNNNEKNIQRIRRLESIIKPDLVDTLSRKFKFTKK